jgi:uncharacterized protein (TIGR02001 family)
MKSFVKRNAMGLALLSTLSVPAFADEGASSLSVNAALSTDYVFRYISQTFEDPAVSGGVDWDSGSGFYMGVWGSNVDFGDDARLEMDFYGGYSFETSGELTVNVGLIDYEYFGNQANDSYFEGFVSIAKGPAFLTVYHDIKSGEYTWVEGGFEHELGLGSTSLTLGTLLVDEGDGYSGWSLGASYPYRSANYTVTAFGTDSDGETQFGKLADTRLVISVDTEF